MMIYMMMMHAHLSMMVGMVVLKDVTEVSGMREKERDKEKERERESFCVSLRHICVYVVCVCVSMYANVCVMEKVMGVGGDPQ